MRASQQNVATVAADGLAVAGALLRATLAAGLLWLCLQDWPAARVLAQLAALPETDAVAQVEGLAEAGRHAEALMVIDARLADAEPGVAVALERLRTEIEADRRRWPYRAGEVARGALRGEGGSGEALAGAVAADLFVFGDVRDLAIQGGRALRGESVDALLVGLSLAGIALTGQAGADAGTAVLKLARRSGALSADFAHQLSRLGRRALRRGDAAPLRRIAGDAAELSRAAGPALSLRLLPAVRHSGDLAAAARLARRPGGIHALWVSGRPGLRWLAQGGPEAERLLLRAARRGPQGARMLWRNAAVLARPHPLIGLLKGVYKGHVPALAGLWLRDHAALLLGLFGSWLLLELLRLTLPLRRLLRRLVCRLRLPSSDASSGPSSEAASGASSGASSDALSGRSPPPVHGGALLP